MVKHLSAMWETRVQSLGQEDPLEKEMATHSSTLAWKIPCTEEPGRLQSMGSLSDFTFLSLSSLKTLSGEVERQKLSDFRLLLCSCSPPPNPPPQPRPILGK